MNEKEANCKGILGIENRTENWKTAWHFAPFVGDSEASKAARKALANRLLSPYKPSLNLKDGEEIELQLFWFGMRDYIDQLEEKDRPTPGSLAELYTYAFPSLHKDLKTKAPRLKSNYALYTEDDKEKLFSNLRSTEIDIVLTTPGYLFIGEAKHESDLDAKGKYLLVHQIIREYVMAKMLVHLVTKPGSPRKQVIPFLIEGKRDLSSKHQVKFMQKQGWLEEKNVLSWREIRELALSGS